MHNKKLRCYLVSTLLFSALAGANTASADIPSSPDANLAVPRSEAWLDRIHTLGQSPGWRALLHYRRSDWHNRWESEVDDPAFFWAEDGQRNATAELAATLQAFIKEPENACRFPARFQWLKDQRMIQPNEEVDCPELAEWLKQFNAHGVTLIFPAAYLNSPSSMFGHTLLRIDQRNQTDSNRLLAHTINYAADADHTDSEWVYAYKGLFGGYPGLVSVLPYYQKVKEYSELENRDIWEYRLNLTQAEITLLLKHTWELQHSYFDYYFFDENCAYRVLALLDVARPALGLTEHFDHHAIPADTVRAVVESGLVEAAVFRPSMATRLRHKSRYLNPEQEQAAVQLAESEEWQESTLKDYDNRSRAAIYEAAFDYLRYRSLDQKLSRDATAKRSHVLLLARSQIPVPSPFPPLSAPTTRDDQGHKTFEFSLALGADKAGGDAGTSEFASVTFRPAYHDLSDPLPGYPPGAQIKFLELELRHYKTNTTRLEQLTLLNVTSLTQRDRFFKSLSWRVDVGWQRKHFQGQRTLMPRLSAGAGLSYGFQNQKAYVLGEAQTELHHDLPGNSSTGVAFNSGWLSVGDDWQQHVNYRHYVAKQGYHHHYQTLNWTLSYHLHKEFSVFGEIQVTRTQGDYYRENRIGLEYRF